MAKILSGKEVAAAITQRTLEESERLRKTGIIPTLVIIRVGDAPGDIAYERGALRRCEQCRIVARSIVLPETVTQDEMLRLMEQLNEDPCVHGVLMLRPLPKHLDSKLIENALIPEKDVDCMTSLSLAGVFMDQPIGFAPCTAQACLEILDYYGIDPTGKRVVVIGRSLVIGKPAAMLLLRRNATVTICHTRTREVAKEASRADILISAAGRAGIVRTGFFRPGQVVIDVGINEGTDGKLVGDVEYALAKQIVGAITPVPGGVGAVTTAVLCSHVTEAARR